MSLKTVSLEYFLFFLNKQRLHKYSQKVMSREMM